MGPFETTFTDPLTTSPCPWVEIVSSPSGSIAVRTLRLPSSVISRSSVTSTTVSGCNRIALFIVKVEAEPSRLGGHIHEYEVGGDALPIGEMRKVQGKTIPGLLRSGWRGHYCLPR